MEKIEKWIENLKNKAVIKKINAFVFSNWFILALGGLTILANVFALELYAYAVITALVMFIALFGDDFLPYIPMFAFCYIMPNPKNNPGVADKSIFYFGSGGKAIMVMACCMVAALLFRLIINKGNGFKRLFKTKYALRYGLFILLGVYLFGGIGSYYYSKYFFKQILFSLLQFFAIAIPYFLMVALVCWKKVDKRYFAYLGLVLGLVVGLETINSYFTNGVIVEGGEIVRAKIYTGWGNYNNMGVLVAMSIPYAFYFVYQGEKRYFYNILAIVLVIFSALTCSRGAILGAGLAYFGCLIFICIAAKDKKIKRITLLTTILLFIGVFLIGFTNFGVLKAAFESGLQSNSRLNLYKEGIKDFLEYPIFGSTFYSIADYYGGWSQLEKFTGFFPARWHNTILQMLASCGIVGLIGYGVHRFQTIKLFVKYKTPEKIFIMFSIIILLGLSMIDCHLFNIGPTMIYSCGLAFVEGMTNLEKNKEAVE